MAGKDYYASDYYASDYHAPGMYRGLGVAVLDYLPRSVEMSYQGPRSASASYVGPRSVERTYKGPRAVEVRETS